MLKNLGYKKTFSSESGLGNSLIIAGRQRERRIVADAFGSLRDSLAWGLLRFPVIAGQLYVDSQANERIRGHRRGFIALFSGELALSWNDAGGKVLGMYAVTSAAGAVTHHWQSIWMKPAAGGNRRCW